MLKKSGILISCHTSPALLPGSRTSPSHTTRCKSQNRQPHRRYAMVSKGYSRDNHGDLRWPEVTSANAVPSPYQIFGQKKGSPYSKQRFYELVKLYHPDRNTHEGAGELSYVTKLERYRLVVAANNILSDPIKRGAYDLYGAGWNGQPEVAGSGEGHPWGGKGWGNNPQGPSQNATWEDWERWYQRDSEGPQQPRFVSNSAFVFLIVLFATLGGIGQATRVGNYSSSFIQQRDELHESVSRDLFRRRKETKQEHDARQQRVETFLKQRDPYGLVDATRYDAYGKVRPPPDVCSAESIKDR